MDRRERGNNPITPIRAAIQDLRNNLWTSIPATVVSFDAAAMTVVAQPAIQAQFRGPTSQTWQNVTLPLCLDCPVVFPGGGGFLATFPLAAGNEGLLVFASKCIDAWWQQGGVQPQAEIRMDTLSDGFFVSGCFSKPNVPGGVSTTTAQLRSKDGSTYVEVTGDQKVNLVAPGGVFINGLKFDTHVHGGVQTGGDESTGPVAP